MSVIRKLLPYRLKEFILKINKVSNLAALVLFKSSYVMTSLWYFLLSRKFDREHQSVLAGRAAYYNSLSQTGRSSALLRRNIHRLEKGLIMQPRKSVFAEGFIGETVDAYIISVKGVDNHRDETKWFTDVLVEYFSVVKDTGVILKARNKFQASVELPYTEERFVPYAFDSLPQTDVSYDQLHTLFIRRRSVRWYQDKDVEMEKVVQAVNLAALAPSACNRQSYRFYVSESREKAVEIAECAGGTPGWVDNIPCTIVIVGDLSAYPDERDRHLIYIDGSLAAMQLMLAFETLGLATCSINWPDIEKAEKKMEKLLRLESYERPIMLLSVGYPEDRGGIPYSQKKQPDRLIKRVS